MENLSEQIKNTKATLKGSDPTITRVNKLLDKAINLLENPKPKSRAKTGEKKKRGPKNGTKWQWSAPRYLLEKCIIDENGNKTWVEIGKFTSAREMLPEFQKIYPKVNEGTLNNFLYTRYRYEKYNLLRVKHLIPSKSKHIKDKFNIE